MNPDRCLFSSLKALGLAMCVLGVLGAGAAVRGADAPPIGSGPATPADVKVAVGHHEGADATGEFKFKEVPAPVKDNAAAKAKFSIVDGEQDGNGAGVEALQDGKLPTEEDQPEANFFFNAGTDGGRIVIDLGAAINVKQVNTYSWHTDSRAPQVYLLYAADGTEKDFSAKPGKEVDPAKAGWKLVANVDTRPKKGDAGGQYGVSVSKADGALGKYRYLLMVASKTEDDDGFGNTFFSEVNVIDADAKPSTAPASEPAKGAAVKVLEIDGGKYTIKLDTQASPDLTEWANTKLAPVVVEWYPKIVKMLPSDGYAAPTKFTITFKPMGGVAYTIGTSVVGSESYFKGHLTDEGAIVHEMVHVVQQYKSPKNPGWLVEGLADYVRWFNYEPEAKRPKLKNPDKAKYTDAYQVTAGFIDYVVRTHDKDFAVKMNADMRQGKYSADLWKTYAGKDVQELWDEYVAAGKK